MNPLRAAPARVQGHSTRCSQPACEAPGVPPPPDARHQEVERFQGSGGAQPPPVHAGSTCRPVWSHTRQEAESRRETLRGCPEAGDRTIENRFTSSSVALRSGVSQRCERFGFQLGPEAGSHACHLGQEDHAEGPRRDRDEAWTEWTPTLGTRFRIRDIDLHSSIRITSGTGSPGIDLIGGGEDVQTVSPSRDFIAATPRGADPRRRHRGHAQSLDPGADPLIPGRRRARGPPAPAPRSPETVRLPPRSRAAFPLDRTPPAL